MKPIYKSRDGSEHGTSSAAKAHNKLLDAQVAFADAAKEVARCLGEQALTSDGEPFDVHHSRDYWRIVKQWGLGFPRIAKIWVWPHSATIDSADAEAKLCVRWYEHSDRGGGNYQSHPICELYADEKKAMAAWLQACRDYAAEVQQELAEIEAKHGGGTR